MRIDLPFPAALNPRTHLLDAHLDVVAARYPHNGANRERWRAARFEQLAGRMYPEAPLPLLALAAEALLWVFEYDDYLVGLPAESELDAARRLQRATAQVLAGELTGRPDWPMGLLWDACHQARTTASRAWWLRFSRDVQEFADVMHAEERSRAGRRPPTQGDYWQLRRGTSGWALLTDLAELAGGKPLAAGVVSSRHCTRLRWAAGDLACTVNDLLSYPKELAAREYHNLVMVLEHSHQVSVAEAKELVAQAIGARLADYHLARAEFLLWCPPSAVHYVRALEHLMRGSLDWSLESGRYPELVGGGHD